MPHQQRGAGVDRTLSEVGVEHVAAQCGGVIREVAVARPRSGDRTVPVDESHTGEAVGAQRAGVDLESAQFTDRPRREGITARLVPSDRPLLDDGDVMARASQPGGDRCSSRTTADDEDVGVQSAVRQPADGGEPGMGTGPTGVMSAMAGTSGDVKS